MKENNRDKKKFKGKEKQMNKKKKKEKHKHIKKNNVKDSLDNKKQIEKEQKLNLVLANIFPELRTLKCRNRAYML